MEVREVVVVLGLRPGEARRRRRHVRLGLGGGPRRVLRPLGHEAVELDVDGALARHLVVGAAELHELLHGPLAVVGALRVVRLDLLLEGLELLGHDELGLERGGDLVDARAQVRDGLRRVGGALRRLEALALELVLLELVHDLRGHVAALLEVLEQRVELRGHGLELARRRVEVQGRVRREAVVVVADLLDVRHRRLVERGHRAAGQPLCERAASSEAVASVRGILRRIDDGHQMSSCASIRRALPGTAAGREARPPHGAGAVAGAARDARGPRRRAADDVVTPPRDARCPRRRAADDVATNEARLI